MPTSNQRVNCLTLRFALEEITPSQFQEKYGNSLVNLLIAGVPDFAHLQFERFRDDPTGAKAREVIEDNFSHAHLFYSASWLSYNKIKADLGIIATTPDPEPFVVATHEFWDKYKSHRALQEQ
jgi:hypothetical protein